MSNFLDILVCPKCKGKLRKVGEGFICEDCGHKYGGEEGTPILE
jgi:uncharacterized protein YbaR (Trm112 family)